MALSVSSIAARAMELAPDLSDTLQVDAYKADVPAAAGALSRYAPQELAIDVTGDGTTRIALSGWDRRADAFRLEYPINEGEIPAPGWTVVRSGAGWSLDLGSALGSGEKARLWYRLPHAVDVSADTTTIPDDLLEPVALLAAGVTLRRLAARYLQQRRAESLSGVELVDLRSQAREALDLAKTLDRQALELLGVIGDDAGASATAGGEDVAVEYVTPPWESIGL